MPIRIGISGWRYTPWRGVFYPKTLPQRLELWYASRILPTIEINGSFYSLQRPEYFAQWHDETPEDFIFAVKGPRFITHMKRLKDVETPLANFFASGVFNLRAKLGPVLWQFPPQFRFDALKFRRFFEQLPNDTDEALRLARKRDYRLKGRARLAIDSVRPIRHAMEVRHESFVTPEFIELLREFNIALVIAETAKRWPMMQDITSDFLYMRLHGDKTLYQSGYSDRALERWAQKIEVWSNGGEPAGAPRVLNRPPPKAKSREVFCYFDNTDVKLRAPVDAQSLMRKLGLRPGDPPFEDPVKAPSRRHAPSAELGVRLMAGREGWGLGPEGRARSFQRAYTSDPDSLWLQPPASSLQPSVPANSTLNCDRGGVYIAYLGRKRAFQLEFGAKSASPRWQTAACLTHIYKYQLKEDWEDL